MKCFAQCPLTLTEQVAYGCAVVVFLLVLAAIVIDVVAAVRRRRPKPDKPVELGTGFYNTTNFSVIYIDEEGDEAVLAQEPPGISYHRVRLSALHDILNGRKPKPD